MFSEKPSTNRVLNDTNCKASSTSPCQPSTSGTVAIKSGTFAVKSFEKYRQHKGKEWNKKAKGVMAKKENSLKEEEVLVNVGLMEWNSKTEDLRPKRGKKLALKVLNTLTYPSLNKQAEEKWKCYHSNLYSEEEQYLLVCEDGKKAMFLPGTSEMFTLRRYKEETGKEYNRITLYLCSQSDYDKSLGLCLSDEGDDLLPNDDGDDMLLNCPARKYQKKITSFSSFSTNAELPPIEICDQEVEHIEADEQFARKVEADWNDELLDQSNKPVAHDSTSSIQPPLDVTDIYKQLHTKVNRETGHFLIVTRRTAPLNRVLSIWQRQTKKTPPTFPLEVKYIAEIGIDSGAIAKEFLHTTVNDVGKKIFPEGSPVNSTYHVQSGNFRTCGEIAATALAQGGPAPCFLEKCSYRSMFEDTTDYENISDDDLTPKELDLLAEIGKDPAKHIDYICENGYGGVIDINHADAVIRSLKVSLVSHRMLYMREFRKGLDVYGLGDLIQSNPDVCEALFVKGNEKPPPDANYLFSLISPAYSEVGSSRKSSEEIIMDHFQDFLMEVEDTQITGYKEVVAWKADGDQDQDKLDSAESNDEHSITPDVSIPGIMGWLTGQRHRHLFEDEKPYITLNFDHECLVRSPNHTICFPLIGACGRDITLPTSHMSNKKDFKDVFLLAFCKGQAFARH